MPKYFVVSYPAAQCSIANNGTDTTAMQAFDDMESVTITAPAALTGTITIQVDINASGTYGTLQSGGSDITIAASKTLVIIDAAFKNMRIHSSSAEGAARQFIVVKKFLA